MQDSGENKTSHADILKIVLIYAVFAGLWIVFSDRVVSWLSGEPDIQLAMRTLKGWFFVGITSALLYFLLLKLIAAEHRGLPTHAMLFNWKRWQVYLFAIVATLFTLLIHLDIVVPFGGHALLILFMFPIMLSAALGGMGPGLLATGLSAIALSYFVLPPTGSLRIAQAYDVFQLGFLIANGLLVSYLSAMLHHIYHRAEHERQKVHEHLADKERAIQLLNSIAEGSTDAIFAKDLQGRYLLFNQAAARTVGKAAADVLGKDDTAIFKPEDAALAMNDDRRVVEAGNVITWEHRLTTTRGETIFSTTQGPLRDKHGDIIGVFGIARDITALKSVEYSLRSERDTNQRYLDTMQNIMVALDDEGRITMINRYGCELLGYREAELLGHNWFKTCLPQPEGMEVVYPLFKQLVSGKTDVAEEFENPLLCRNGIQRLISWHNGLLKNNIGNIVGTLSSGVDITERKIAEDQLRKLSLAVEQSPESIFISNLDANIEYVNEAFIRNTGYTREEVIGKNPRMLQSGKTPQATYQALWQSLKAGETWQGELCNKRKDGSEYIMHAIISPIRQPDGRIMHYVAVEEDITRKKQVEADLNRLAFYDSLTGLPNRALLLDLLGRMLPIAQRQRRHDALLLINIDRFKSINDTSGQAAGDAMLKAFGERLAGMLREGDVLARISGDEFAIMLPDISTQQHAASHQSMHVAEKIHYGLREAFAIGDERFTLTASIGIALFPLYGKEDDALDILRRANTALHQAKAKGDGKTRLFELDMDESTKQRFLLERELRQAVAAGELRLYLQPQVDASGREVGAEALVRWQHPQRGLMPPALFIPIAEESDLILDIGQWVMAEVCKYLTRDVLLGRPYRIAVNISPRQFRQKDFVGWLKGMLAASGAEATRLTLEITEGVVIDNLNNVIAMMNELAVLGIHFSLDDFGTGYSSLAYLKRLPINEVKIDKTFVQDAPSDPGDAALIESILAVARHMHLQVVAEGVETQEQADFLNTRGSIIHQGHLFGRPEPAEKVLASLTS